MIKTNAKTAASFCLLAAVLATVLAILYFTPQTVYTLHTVTLPTTGFHYSCISSQNSVGVVWPPSFWQFWQTETVKNWLKLPSLVELSWVWYVWARLYKCTCFQARKGVNFCQQTDEKARFLSLQQSYKPVLQLFHCHHKSYLYTCAWIHPCPGHSHLHVLYGEQTGKEFQKHQICMQSVWRCCLFLLVILFLDVSSSQVSRLTVYFGKSYSFSGFSISELADGELA